MQDKTTKQDKETLKTRQSISLDPQVLAAIKFAAEAENLNLSAYINKHFKEVLSDDVERFKTAAETTMSLKTIKEVLTATLSADRVKTATEYLANLEKQDL